MISRSLAPVKQSDSLKWIFLFPKIFLQPLGLWPEKQMLWKRILFFIITTACVTEEFGHLWYLIQNRKNINEIPTTVICTTTVFQAISKIVTIYIHGQTLKQMHQMVQNEFWPSHLFGKSFEINLKKLGNTASCVMIFIYITAVIYFVGLFTMPLSMGNYKLPLNVNFGVNFSFSPLFEILYFLQCWTNMFVVIYGIRGHDDLFVSLAINYVGQFKLLGKAVSYIGTGNEYKINLILDEIDTTKHNYKQQEEKLLIRCIEHHKKLLKFCDYMERAFTGSLCVQLLVSVIAICVSSFALIVVDIKITELPGLFSYCFGHITQLFIFCVLGNEITYMSAAFADSIYHCEWQNEYSSDLRKMLPLIMLQSNERPRKITAMGIVTFNNSSFIKVMRLSFSYHTLLSKFFERNQ